MTGHPHTCTPLARQEEEDSLPLRTVLQQHTNQCTSYTNLNYYYVIRIGLRPSSDDNTPLYERDVSETASLSILK